MGKTSRYELIVIKAEEKDISDIYLIGTVSISLQNLPKKLLDMDVFGLLLMKPS